MLNFNRASNLYFPVVCLMLVLLPTACKSGDDANKDAGTTSNGIVIVNAPAAGEVRRVLVREGMTISKGTPVVEIAVRNEATGATKPQADDPVARAGQNIQASEAEIKAARDEVVRTDVEVQRLSALVASGAATQGELDAARALYERAQQRLQQAQTRAQDAQAGLVAARQPSRNQTVNATAAPSEQLVYASATSAGTVRVVSARVGERVTAGQPLATLRTQ